MYHTLFTGRFLCPAARNTLQFGLSLGALLLWCACLLLITSGSLCSANISEHLLARQLQSASLGVLFLSVICTSALQERLGT